MCKKVNDYVQNSIEKMSVNIGKSLLSCTQVVIGTYIIYKYR